MFICLWSMGCHQWPPCGRRKVQGPYLTQVFKPDSVTFNCISHSVAPKLEKVYFARVTGGRNRPRTAELHRAEAETDCGQWWHSVARRVHERDHVGARSIEQGVTMDYETYRIIARRLSHRELINAEARAHRVMDSGDATAADSARWQAYNDEVKHRAMNNPSFLVTCDAMARELDAMGK